MEAVLTRASYLDKLEDTYLTQFVRFVHKVPQQSNRVIYDRVENINCEDDGDDVRIIVQIGRKHYELSRLDFEARTTIL
jgi:hypothetical protein